MADKEEIILKRGGLELKLDSERAGSLLSFGCYTKDKNKQDKYQPFLINTPENSLNINEMASYISIPFAGDINECSLYKRDVKSQYNQLVIPWDIKERRRWENLISLRYSHNGEKGFPFKFEAKQIVKLSWDLLKIDLLIQNNNDVPMPFGAGVRFNWARYKNMRITADFDKMYFNAAPFKDVPVNQATSDIKLLNSYVTAVPSELNCSKPLEIAWLAGVNAAFLCPSGKLSLTMPDIDRRITLQSSAMHVNIQDGKGLKDRPFITEFKTQRPFGFSAYAANCKDAKKQENMLKVAHSLRIGLVNPGEILAMRIKINVMRSSGASIGGPGGNKTDKTADYGNAFASRQGGRS